MEYYSALRKKKILTFVMTWMDLKVIMLSGIVCYHFKNPNSVIHNETEERMVVTRGWGVEEIGDVGQRIHSSDYKLSKFWVLMYSLVTKVNNNIDTI